MTTHPEIHHVVRLHTPDGVRVVCVPTVDGPITPTCKNYPAAIRAPKKTAG